MAIARPLDQIRPYTKSPRHRLESMRLALKTIERKHIYGDVVECGVWRGGNILLARMLAPTRQCWCYDTFDGMTEPSEFDIDRGGENAIIHYNQKKNGGTKWSAVSFKEVKKIFKGFGLYDNVRFVIGPVEQTLQHTVPNSIALLRLDVDWYESTKACLRFLYPLLSPGGFLIVDDYGHWMGCKKAVDEYFNENVPSFHDVDYTCRIFHKC